MSMVPQAIHSNLSRPHPTDSRLLQNLIKGEKTYIENLAASSASAYAAASALAAWGTSEAPDISQASQTLAEILSSAAEAQRTHVQAMEGYRSALKDVLDREQSIRSVVRDRDILVGRLIKASKKKVSKKDSGGSYEEKNERVAAAQRELHACEQVLASEEAALVGVKRRTFKEALTMRMKTMGDAGAAMVEVAKEAILLLDEFDTHGPLLQATGGGQYESMYADEGVEAGDYDDNGAEPNYYPEHNVAHNGDARSIQQGHDNVGSGTGLVPDGFGGFHKSVDDTQEHDPRLSQQFEMASVTPSQSASQVVDNNRSSVPLGQRYSSQFDNVEEKEGTPSETDSEEDYRRAFIEPRMNLPAPHHLGVAADTHDVFVPQSQRVSRSNTQRTAKGGQSAPAPPKKDPHPIVPMPAVPSAARLDINQTRNFGHIPNAPPAQSRARGEDDSSDEGFRPRRNSFQGSRLFEDGRSQKKGLFGKVSQLFKTDIREDSISERPSWESRIHSPPQDSKRTSMIRRNEPDSSDDEPDKRDLIRHVNKPKPLWGRDTNSDIGVKGKLNKVPSIARITSGPMSSKAREEEDAKLATIRASVVGNGFLGTDSAATSITSKKKKKVKKAGSEIGTAPTRSAGTASDPPTKVTVSGDASSGIRRSDSLMVGGVTKPGLSRSSTMQSTASKKKRASLMSSGMASSTGNLNAFSPNEGKYNTASWINKPTSHMTAAEAVAMAGVVPRQPTLTPTLEPAPPWSQPASIPSSASKSMPLKPALKSASLSRAASTANNSPKKAQKSAPPVKSSLRNETTAQIKAPSQPQPQMSPILIAPAPVTSQPLPESKPVSTLAPQLPVIGEQVKAPKSVLSLEEDKAFDGTGHLDVSAAQEESPAKTASGAVTPRAQDGTSTPSKINKPVLEMPSSEPFRIDVEGLSKSEMQRRGSAVTASSGPEEALLTPSAEEAYKSFMQQSPAAPTPTVTINKSEQPPSVTRLTDRKVKLEPSRVYGAGAPDLSDTSSEFSSVRRNEDTQLAGGAQAAADVQALADPSLDKELEELSNKPAPTLATLPGSDLGRRKSVRMAPDVKLPPDTPNTDEFATPRGNEYGGQDPMASSALSNRIAPPPAAPARAKKEEDLGASSGWSSRIRQEADDSSSDEDEDYSNARKAFGWASKSWGEATGTASIKSTLSKKKTTSVQSPSMYSVTAPAPLSNVTQAEVPKAQVIPSAPASVLSQMPAISQSPTGQNDSPISVPTAPASPKKGFFSKFKKSK